MTVEVDDRKWRDIAAKVKSVADRIARVGVLGSAGSQGGTSLVDIAAFQEFGTVDIPERSFLRSTFAAKTLQLNRLLEKVARQIVINGMTIDVALGLVGTWAVAQVKRTIMGSDIPPPLAQSTIDAKGSSKPLVDTGQLVNAITYEIGNKP